MNVNFYSNLPHKKVQPKKKCITTKRKKRENYTDYEFMANHTIMDYTERFEPDYHSIHDLTNGFGDRYLLQEYPEDEYEDITIFPNMFEV